MAIGWLSVLKAVPWTEVITNAPKVADGAKKLWNSVGKKATPPTGAAPSCAPDTGATQISELEARLAAMEAAASELHAQMLASSEVIKALAEQNAQLISGVEAIRVRARWLIGAALVSFVLALASLALTFGR